jgi:hypothetical protein
MADVVAGKFKLSELVRDLSTVCRRGIGGWENFQDENGKPIPFIETDGEADAELLANSLELGWLFALAMAVLLNNQMTEGDKKK